VVGTASVVDTTLLVVDGRVAGSMVGVESVCVARVDFFGETLRGSSLDGGSSMATNFHGRCGSELGGDAVLPDDGPGQAPTAGRLDGGRSRGCRP